MRQSGSKKGNRLTRQIGSIMDGLEVARRGFLVSSLTLQEERPVRKETGPVKNN